MNLFDMNIVASLVPVIVALTEIIGKKLIGTTGEQHTYVSYAIGVLAGVLCYFTVPSGISIVSWIFNGIVASTMSSGGYSALKGLLESLKGVTPPPSK